MSRLLMSAVLISIIVGVLVGCGTSHDPTVSTRSSQSDQALARRSVLLPPHPGSGWQQTGQSNEAALDSCPTHHMIYAGLDAHADSPVFTYRKQFKLGAAAYVYVDTAAAQHALRVFTSPVTQACLARSTLAFLRNARYTVIGSHISSGLTLDTRGSQTAHIEVLAQYGGQPYIVRIDTTAVRVARVVGILSTVAEARSEGKARLDHALMIRLKNLADDLRKLLSAAQNV